MTINVVCRRDAINRNRLAPLALVFTHDRRRKFVGLGISEALVHWDFDKQQPTADCPDRAEIQFQITSKIREYEKKIKKLEVLEIPVTFDTLFEQNGKRINCTVGEYFKQIIERLEKVEKYSSASKHKVTLVLVSQFRSVNMRFDELDLTYLREFEIFLSQKGNVNNSCNYAAFQYCRLYLIEILHQTTTHCKCIQFTLCCILSKFYIKPQHEPLASHIPRCCILSKFYIKPQLRCFWNFRFFVVSYWNSTSNHNILASIWILGIVVSYWNSTSNHNNVPDVPTSAVVVSYWNSTSNHNSTEIMVMKLIVVSYWNSTSNHNHEPCFNEFRSVVSYWNSTSNHNASADPTAIAQLYLIEILHQTTTTAAEASSVFGCILLKFYIKPQQWIGDLPETARCILLKFYIKPQQPRLHFHGFLVVSYWNSTSNHNRRFDASVVRIVVSYWNSTSNHNSGVGVNATMSLYLIEILHQTTTLVQPALFPLGCILLKFYIKPQQRVLKEIRFLCCILLKFYIKPQLSSVRVMTIRSCILLKFYIKPQHRRFAGFAWWVVSYWNSTSNHNRTFKISMSLKVVSYWNSTSNHNSSSILGAVAAVVSYWNSTSNHNSGVGVNATMSLYLIEILHQTTTKTRINYNYAMLYLIEILHQTTTIVAKGVLLLRCILLKFYIKPQRRQPL